jgi:antitoxin component of MazEF toxin-antitoxin module
MRYGRSYVLTIPYYVAQRLNVQRGDTFTVLFDDERRTVTYQKIFEGTSGPKVEVNGQVEPTQIMR